MKFSTILKNKLQEELIFNWLEPKQMDHRLKILESGLDIILEQGIAALTLSELARKSGFSKPRLAYTYTDMQDVVLDLLKLSANYGQKITLDEIQKGDSPQERILAIARGAMRWMNFYPNFGRFWLMIYSYAPQHERVFELHRQIVETGRARVESNLREMGIPTLPARRLSIQIQSVIFGNIFRLTSLNESAQSETILADLEATIRELLAPHQDRAISK